MLKFNEETHEYFYNDRKIPCVTEVLKACGMIDTTFYNQDGTIRGKRAHEAIEMYNMGLLRVEAAPSDVQGYLKGYVQFRLDLGSRLEIIQFEKPEFHQQFLYSGTPDLVARIDGKTCIVDFKTGAPAVWHSLQLSAYAAFFWNSSTVDVYTLNLKKTGKYSLVKMDVDLKREFNIFLACLTIFNWKQQNYKGEHL